MTQEEQNTSGKPAPQLPDQPPSAPQIVDLIDLVEGGKDLPKDTNIYIEIAVKETGRIYIFHTHAFSHPIGWIEFDTQSRQVTINTDSGLSHTIPLPVSEDVAKYMQNAHQILLVHLDIETGGSHGGQYIPLIIHTP